MKTLKPIAALLFAVTFMACKSDKTQDVTTSENVQHDTVPMPKTYAEISVAQGGAWKEREYLGGTSFKNVTNLKVPDSHTDHSWYIRYEGPGWESNKVGYRLYLDWRNAIDIFGKVTDTMVLAHVGQDGFDSYHEPQPWGQDILKVGKGLGIGSIGRLVNNEVLHFNEVDSTFASIENGANKSTVTIDYKGWKTGNDIIDLKSVLSISANKRYTKHTIAPSKAIKGIVTGIVNHNVEYFQKVSDNQKWAYIATYGEQTLVPDNLGMAIFYEVETTSEVKKGTDDYLIEFKPTTNPVSFYFLGAWEQEPNGIKTQEEFLSYLNEKLMELNNNNSL